MAGVELLDPPFDHLVAPRPAPHIKTVAERTRQLAAVETVVGEPFLGDPHRRAEVLALDEKELKAHYPRAYAHYLKLVREVAHLKAENLALAEAELGEEVRALSHEDRADLASPSEEQLQQLAHNIEHQYEIVSARNYLRMTNNLAAYIERYEPGHSEGGPLREHQQDVCHAFLRFLEHSSGRRGYIDMPTGTGKTAVFVELIEALAGHPAAGEAAPLKTLVIVPTKDLVAQTLGDEARGFAAFAPNLHVTSYYQENKDLSGDVVVTTYDSLLTLVRTGRIPARMFDLVVADEAHHALGPGAQWALEQLMGQSPDALLLGFTATPEYSNKEERRVATVFEQVIHRLDLREAIQRGILASVRWDFFTVPMEEIRDFTGARVLGGDYTPELLRRLNTEERNREAVRYVERALASGRQTLVSCLPIDPKTGIRHLHQMADLINAAHIQIPARDQTTGELSASDMVTAVARAIDGQIPPEERRQLLDDFRTSRIHVLTFVDVLKEGVDLPNAKVLINLRPTRSPVLETQRVGRILRPSGQEAWVVEARDPLGWEAEPYTMDHVMGEPHPGITPSGRSRRGGRRSSRETENFEPLPEIIVDAQEIPGGWFGPKTELPQTQEDDRVQADSEQAKTYVDVMGREWLALGGVLERYQLERSYFDQLTQDGGLRPVLRSDRDHPTKKHLLYPADEIERLLTAAPVIEANQVELDGETWLDSTGIGRWLETVVPAVKHVRIPWGKVTGLIQMYVGEEVRMLAARRQSHGGGERYELVYRQADLAPHAGALARSMLGLVQQERTRILLHLEGAPDEIGVTVRGGPESSASW